MAKNSSNFYTVCVFFSGYHVYFDPQVMALLPTDIENKGFAQKFRQNINETGVYFRHTPFFNFTKWHVPTPIYMSVVRHPIGKKM